MISVVVPIYKVEKYLHRCVDSILNQTFTDFELILVDDGSPDNCGKICDEYAEKDSRIHVIHKENGGLSDARNAGIDWAFENSNSDWITFIDSDDWIHRDYLKVLYSLAISNNCNISACAFLRTDGNLSENGEFDSNGCGVVFFPEEYYCNHNINATISCAKLYKRNCFKNIRFPVGKLHEDEYVTYRVLFNEHRIVYCDMPMYYYFENNQSITRAKWSPKKLDGLYAIEEQLSYFSKVSISVYNERREFLWSYLVNVLEQIELCNDVSYNKYKRLVRNKLRFALVKYKAFPIKKYFYYYHKAFKVVENAHKLYHIFKKK